MARHEHLRNMVLSALFAALLVVSGRVMIPLPWTPVPITLQTLVVMVAGALLGPWWGATSVVIFLVMGAAGAPVFAGGAGGAVVLVGPTGGYIFAWLVAVIGIGWLLRLPIGGRHVRLWIAVMLFGVVAIDLLGTIQLAAVGHLGFGEALLAGVVPFLPGDIAKAVVTVGVTEAVAAALPNLPGTAPLAPNPSTPKPQRSIF